MTGSFVVSPHSPDRKRLGSPPSTREQLALLNDAGRLIGSTLDLGQTGRELMEVTIPRFADAAGVLVHDRLVTEGEFPARASDGSAIVRRIAVGTSSRAEDYHAAFPLNEATVFPAWSPYARCMATAQPILYPRLDAKSAREIARTWERDIVASLLEDNSFLVVPLQARGRVLGFVVFTRMPDSSPFHERDVSLAQELANRTALCLDNAR